MHPCIRPQVRRALLVVIDCVTAVALGVMLAALAAAGF